MDKKLKQKRPAQLSRMTDDILNMNEGASKKRKQSLPAHLRPSILKKLKLKPDPTLLFSQFKPKENEDKENNTSDTSKVVETSGSQVNVTTKDSSKAGIPKGWTPPLKNVALLTKSDDTSTSLRSINISKKCSNEKKIAPNRNLKNTKIDNNFQTGKNTIGSENGGAHQDATRNHIRFASMNSPDVARKPFSDGSLGIIQMPHLEKNQDQSHQMDVEPDSSTENPCRDQVGIQSLLKAIVVVEANTEHINETENSNVNECNYEADVRDGKQVYFKDIDNKEISSTSKMEQHSNELLKENHSHNDVGHISVGEVIENLIEKSFKSENQPIEQFTDETTNKDDPSSVIIDLTHESEELESSDNLSVGEEESAETTNVVDKRVDDKLDRFVDECMLNSGSVKYTETVIKNLSSPVICTIVNEARNSTEVLKFLGSDSSKNKSRRLDQVCSTRESSENSEMNHEKNTQLNGPDDCVINNEEDIDAEDEKIMKEIRIYVYDSLTSSQKVEHGSIQYENKSETAGPVCKSGSMESQNSETSQVTDTCHQANGSNTHFDQTNNNDDSHAQETGIDCIVEENEVEHTSEQSNEDETGSCQQNGNMGDYDCQQNKDDKTEGNKATEIEIDEENYMKKSEESSKGYINMGENEEKEANICEEYADQVISNNNQGDDPRSKLGNDKTEFWNEDDDAFDEVIDMSCTQLIHIENEYSNKNKENEKVGRHVDTNRPTTSQNELHLSIGQVKVPWVSDESKKNGPIQHQSIQWVGRLAEEKHKLRTVVQELSKLNDLILQARQILWPRMKK